LTASKKLPYKIAGEFSFYFARSFLIRTLPSAQESHLFGTFVFAGFTAGMEFHHSPKISIQKIVMRKISQRFR
jgi:hypothetical protein